MIRIGDNIEIPCGKSLFPDHALLLKLDPWSVKTNSYNIVIEWLYEGDSELFTLICVKRHLEQYYPYGTFTLDMPYIGHARMDRVKMHSADSNRRFCGAKRTRCGASGLL